MSACGGPAEETEAVSAWSACGACGDGEPVSACGDSECSECLQGLRESMRRHEKGLREDIEVEVESADPMDPTRSLRWRQRGQRRSPSALSRGCVVVTPRR